MSEPAMPARLELDALIAERDDLEREHEAAVAALEAVVAEGKSGGTVFSHRRDCERLHDRRAAVQKRIDEHLARERGR